MALFGSLSSLRSQLVPHAHFDTAFAYLEKVLQPGSPEQARVLAIPVGVTERIELAGGAFAMEQVYLTKPREQGFFESHRAYIDVQVIVRGEELMEVADVAKLAVSEDFTPGKDLIKYQMYNAASIVRVGAGEGAVFFPVDGHMPTLAVEAPAPLYKTVVKIPVFA
jgi:uncharacterized protein, YhcH/YjgK/YiaL family